MAEDVASLARYDKLFDALRFGEAVAECDRLLEQQPECSRVYAARGFALFALERFDLAVMEFERAIELEPDNCDWVKAARNDAIAHGARFRRRGADGKFYPRLAPGSA